MQKIILDPISATSLRIELFFQDLLLSTATGFTIIYNDKSYLITNWHVVSGRDADTNKCLDRNAAIPDQMIISFHAKNNLGKWNRITIPLIDENGAHLWLEHPLGRDIDVVAIPLNDNPLIDIYPLDLASADKDILVSPAMPVSAVGFPLGLVAGENWPIWKTGHIASDPNIDFQPNRPAFLIDATTRAGMSGSPVMLRLVGGYSTTNGGIVMDGRIATKFLGIYAGRIHNDSEIGRVWRPFIIKEIIEKKLFFGTQSGRTTLNRNTRCLCNSGRRFKACCGSM